MKPTLKLWIYWDFPVRAKRGELKGPGGCLRKSSQSTHATLAECRAEVSRYASALDYGSLACAEVYTLADWTMDCLTAKPVMTITAPSAA